MDGPSSDQSAVLEASFKRVRLQGLAASYRGPPSAESVRRARRVHLSTASDARGPIAPISPRLRTYPDQHAIADLAQWPWRASRGAVPTV